MISEERLRNWGRYVRLGRFRKGHCLSIEHRVQGWYNPPQSAQIEWLYGHGLISEAERIKLYADIAKPRPAVVDAADADLIEFGWRWMSDDKYKWAIKQVYVKRWSTLMLQHKMRERDIDGFMILAVNNIAKAIDKISAMTALGVYPRMDNLIPHRHPDDQRLAA